MANTSFSQRIAVMGALPKCSVISPAVLPVGFLAPLSGPESSWGGPGLDGCRIWVDWINTHGGLMVAGQRRRVELLVHDSALSPERTLAAARDMVEQHGVPLVLTLGGDSFAPAMTWLMARRILVATLLPSDLSPDTPSLIAPVEIHPLYNVTGVEWMARNHPSARRVALCSQEDRMGQPSLAIYRAAFEAAGREIVKEVRYAPDDADMAGIVRAMLAEKPDLLCWCTSPGPMVQALTQAAWAQGYRGPILSSTADHYPQMMAQTSSAFMADFIFQFPDFDDPLLADAPFFFSSPKTFFEDYNARFPGAWTAVSWEYAAILDLWHNAVENADSIAPATVLAAMKRRQLIPHAFGAARWWGAEIFGIDNALVGRWPVVGLREGRARILEFGSVLDWLERHGPLLRRHMEQLGLLWEQRLSSRQPEG
ncbi:ABC transporter substrate-binding protein [Xanthobacter sp. TB0139]|uniref:ABC transporter substrate-binding protein n=1 Tax=Xanthobacter sp. TB0139 TaxID=3459178 RepID=UPI0040390F36